MSAGTLQRVQVPGEAVPARRSWPRRVARRLGALGAVLVALGVVVLGVGWASTPAVDDAAARVAAHLAENDAPALQVEPAPAFVQALLATEDAGFASHPGVSPTGAVRAFWGLLSGTDQGGSTLVQQLAKNVYLDGENGPVQKAEAVLLAVKLDATYSKDDLLRMYLDNGYYGHGFVGLPAATEGYFGVPPDQLSWAQSTLLAGLFQAPTAYDPLVHPDLAAQRQAHVLDRLVDEGVLTRAAADTIAAEDWGIVAG
ncbi:MULTISPECIES: biosynthetic peptidoglycan transglycosylase [unclassified Modestobacter]|uniref:biosynthetic peptidoglycan transglycosylase n=1 Tax=unclassified Modestobacter TaxID=2643866 RepID=UPI0022AA4C7B|nr:MULTISPECIES: biosynthetic peptidoglycan transglycosylase [unclassified Modestobacter]MCZ2826614.1 transglycosylase domain-containing protein [Modestobacter sp. VKM Ac-2981]MCZ2854994.1 transglycosylase domain-containing protein [Modestobacter sp. VKM Ac-2982]